MDIPDLTAPEQWFVWTQALLVIAPLDLLGLIYHVALEHRPADADVYTNEVVKHVYWYTCHVLIPRGE